MSIEVAQMDVAGRLTVAIQRIGLLRGALINILDCVENHGGHDMVVEPTKEHFGHQLLMTTLIREVLEQTEG